ncbi:MAG: polysaccharide biosynthesis/export family protein [Deltaproteobacteria bacterium]|nr:polysaccharide biosynthesis/export family protein [Deltaproteobacteria bacterium]MBW2647046.1 polysaccharide biosynthesis/export family protein [Deltaproteobacteria bacterium]
MKNKRTIQILAMITLIFAGLSACASQQSNITPEAAALTASPSIQPAPYLIQPGDQLDIKFFYNPEINETVTVRPDGKISLQLVDEVQAAGLKPSQLDDELTKKYSQELKKPMITVIVRSFGGQRIFVGGEVNRQGLITIAGNMTPLQAVLKAGGFKETSNPESAIIIRKGTDNRPVPIAMNLTDVMQGKSGNADFLLQADDIVYVPKSAIAKANKFVNQYIEDLLLFRGVSLGFSYEVHGDND